MAFSQIQDDIEKLSPRGAGIIGMTAEEDVIAGQVVKLGAASNSVEPSDTDGEEVFGVATQTVSAGDSVAVAGPGTIANVRANGATSPGAIASDGATGEEGEVAAAATGDETVGILLDDLGAGEYGQAFILPGAGAQVN